MLITGLSKASLSDSIKSKALASAFDLIESLNDALESPVMSMMEKQIKKVFPDRDVLFCPGVCMPTR